MHKIDTKAVTYDEQPKMKRDAWQKSSLFLRKGLLFCRASLFISGRSTNVTALIFKLLKLNKIDRENVGV